ncbi:MAG: ATP-binding cassette domain-containing protein, partial [Pseudomonadota bacterium]
AGFEAATEGAITLDGQDIAPIPPNKRPVNMMFQSYALFPHLNIWDNIAFGLRRSGATKANMHARVDEMLRLTRLEDLAHRKPHQVSGGQRQRVALARSLALAPKLLLLDEPLGALDKKLRQQTQFELMDIQDKIGTTFIIVTHDQEEAMTVATRVAVMKAGQLAQVDTPQGIYENPQSRFVADFVGEVTILEGTATAEGEDLRITFGEGQPPIIARTDRDIAGGTQVGYAIRPEKINVTAEKPGKPVNQVQGTIVDIGYLGDVSTYHVRLDSGQIVKARMTNASRRVKRAFTWDDRVWLSWNRWAGVVLTA